MTIETKIDKKNRIIYRKCSGNISVDDMINDVSKTLGTEFMESLRKDEESKIIWDLRMAKLRLNNMDELKKFYSIFANLKSDTNIKCSFNVVLWVTNKSDYIVATTSQAFFSIDSLLSSEHNFKIFLHKTEILNWLNLNEKDIDYF